MHITASYFDQARVETIEAATIRFPGGEVQVRLSDLDERLHRSGSTFHIRADIRSSENLMELLMATDAIRRYEPEAEILLLMPYIPYARQDRVAVPGEALSIKVFAQIINSQNYNRVGVWDAHSDVSLALLDRAYHVTAADLIRDRQVQHLFDGHVIVAPDAGAVKRASAVAKVLGTDLVRAEKTRNSRTGEVTGTRVQNVGEYGAGSFMIVDDICDGGRTFIELAKGLRRVSERPISLYVTHGIFSGGFDHLRAHLDRIICANVLTDATPPDNFLIKI